MARRPVLVLVLVPALEQVLELELEQAQVFV